jgi:hypothetical protein
VKLRLCTVYCTWFWRVPAWNISCGFGCACLTEGSHGAKFWWNCWNLFAKPTTIMKGFMSKIVSFQQAFMAGWLKVNCALTCFSLLCMVKEETTWESCSVVEYDLNCHQLHHKNIYVWQEWVTNWAFSYWALPEWTNVVGEWGVERSEDIVFQCEWIRSEM